MLDNARFLPGLTPYTFSALEFFNKNWVRGFLKRFFFVFKGFFYVFTFYIL